MTLPHRRQFLHLTAGAVALPIVSREAWAQIYPARPVHWIVTAAAGDTADIFARLLGSWLSERLGQQFVVENRTGAGGNIGTKSVVRSPADGYTIHLTATSDAINATLYDKHMGDLTYPRVCPVRRHPLSSTRYGNIRHHPGIPQAIERGSIRKLTKVPIENYAKILLEWQEACWLSGCPKA